MLFANGDCYITYESNNELNESLLSRVQEDGYQFKYIESLKATPFSITFKYSPIEVMEMENTIEPCDIVIPEVRTFLEKKGIK